MDRRSFLNTVVIGGSVSAVLGTPFKASAETYNNSSYFGGALLRDAGANLHDGKTHAEIIQSLGNGGYQYIYTASNVANAFTSAWSEAEGSAVDIIKEGAASDDFSALDTLISGRRDQSLMESLAYQHSNVIPEAIRDIEQGNGLRRGYEQIADEGVKALVSLLNQTYGTADYENVKQAIEGEDGILAHIESAYVNGIDLFAKGLRSGLELSQRDQPAAPSLPRLNDI